MKTRAIFLFSVAIIAGFGFGNRVSAAGLEPSDYLSRGIACYDQKDYTGAEQYLLKAINGEFAHAAIAHYYLANALMQTRKTTAALDQYQTCYELAPFSSFSGYCRMMLLRHGRNPDEKNAAGKSAQENAVGKNAQEQPRGKISDKQTKVTDLPSETKPATDPELAKLSGRLPKPIEIVKESPSASEIMAGNISYRASFVGEAEGRKARALERLEQARQALTRVESMTHSFVPSAKAFGEAEQEFRARRQEAEKSVSSLLDPFRESVKAADTAFQTESNLYDSCINASRGFQY